VVHGLLHCVGFSHDRPRGSSRMRRMAEALLTFRAPPAS
jgi:ssRNA-specific RNase YbeY (16S rRNA maturation enzyme)